MIDPPKNYEITEFAPRRMNNIQKSPTAILTDHIAGMIYASQPEESKVSLFNELTHIFNVFQPSDPRGLPFGMTLDKYRNLWVAEHTINKVAFIDPLTGASREVELPTQSPFVQWFASDSRKCMAQRTAGKCAWCYKEHPSPARSEVAMPIENDKEKTLPEMTLYYSQIIEPMIAVGPIAVSNVCQSTVVIPLSVHLLKRAKESR
jgi:copper transport protein